MFDQVVQEARDKLKGCKSPTTKYDKMMRLGEDDHPGETIIKRGAALRKRLLVDITNNELRWKILVDFWADMMLFVAPSDDITVHGEHLTEGGEFVTYLWAFTLSCRHTQLRLSSECLINAFVHVCFLYACMIV